MAKYRIVRTEFWKNPIVSEEMTPEDKYFYLYLLTNPNTTQIGIYRITKKQMAFDLGYSIESVHSLMERFTLHHKLIRYVAETIRKQDIRSLYESFCESESMSVDQEDQENGPSVDVEEEEVNETFVRRSTIRGQKEKQKQKAFNPSIENNPDIEDRALDQNISDAQEIVAFWDNNGFGFSNVNAKQQLLSWLDDSSFLQPREVILKAMKIACANNKRKLNYINSD